MTLQKQINEHLKNAILTSNTNLKSILRVLIGEMNRIDKEVSDDKVISIVKKMIENAKLLNNETEVEILSTYLPKQMTADELKVVINHIINYTNLTTKKDMGKIMSLLKTNHGGTYDGKEASSILNQILD